ncbi:YebC/PmpR family DNA-binding transcriptional regulator, partial [Marinomonas aquimarina]|uniref:YebC/PmpR family DNA-binding transcriptional regulator n=2 Tax=Pseudomonadota TaxID=1224 RepID=UPI0018D4C21E
LTYPASVADADAMFEAAVEAGADNVESTDDDHEIICDPGDFADVRDALIEKFGPPTELGLQWKPQNTISLNEDQASTMLKLIDT